MRAVAFATAVIGEAALLAGDLDHAESQLHDSADMHREMGAPAGEAHALQRLAEVALAEATRRARVGYSTASCRWRAGPTWPCT
jgi:hypothetical protein